MMSFIFPALWLVRDNAQIFTDFEIPLNQGLCLHTCYQYLGVCADTKYVDACRKDKHLCTFIMGDELSKTIIFIRGSSTITVTLRTCTTPDIQACV